MSNIIKFQDADIDLSVEYSEARRLMGLKATNLEELQRAVMHVYITIPSDMPKWADAYVALIHEIAVRQAMIMRLKLDALTCN